MLQTDPANPTLSSLQDLAQLSEQYGLIKVKPFKDWDSPKWKNRIFTFRLCNAGEIYDIYEFCSDIPDIVKEQATKIELLIHAIWEIDERTIISSDELKKYNETHKSKLSDKEYLRAWFRNIEQLVLDRLFGIYEALQAKQIRLLQSALLCTQCGQIYGEGEIPDGSYKLTYSVADILCAKCIPEAEEGLYDFEMVEAETPPEKSQDEAGESEEEKPDKKKSELGRSINYTPYLCPCGETCDTIEEFTAHRETCEKAE